MITLGRAAYQTQGRNDEYYGLSTDPKPTDGVENGSTLYIMDKQEVWMYDKTNNTWIKQ